MIFKGLVLGILIFSVLFAAQSYRMFLHTMNAPGVLSQLTIFNVFFWLELIGCVLVGIAIVGYWPIKAPGPY